MAANGDDGRRKSQLTTIPETDADDVNEVLEKIMCTPRKRREQTPSKRTEVTESGTRRRSQRHSAEHAREKITSLYNADRGDRFAQHVSETESDDGDQPAWLPVIEEDELPKNECNVRIYSLSDHCLQDH